MPERDRARVGARTARSIEQEGLGKEHAKALDQWRMTIDTLTTTLKREWFAKIVDGTKRIEYRGDQAVLDVATEEGEVAVSVGTAQWHDAADSGADGAD